MDTEKIIKKIAAQEGVPAWYIRHHMQECINMADWSKLGPQGVKPKTIEEAMNLIIKHSSL